MGHPILLYDGVCALCNWTVRFVLQRDRKKLFRFASLQSAFGAQLLSKISVIPSEIESAYIVVFSEDGQTLLQRSDAVLFVLRNLGGIWSFFAHLGACLPRSIRDRAYRFVARHRYQLFGKYETCPLPKESDRDRFIEI